jgi:hypothetical protein
MWCTTKSVTILFVVLATLALPAHAPIPALLAPSTRAPHPSSCKPRPPLVLEVRAASQSADRWMLALRSLDIDRDVQVWMQATRGDRRFVWRGRLSVGEEKRVEVAFAAPPGTESVLVALEPLDMGPAIVRAFVAAPVPGSKRLADTQAGLLLEDPTSGVKVRQYTGAVGGQR